MCCASLCHCMKNSYLNHFYSCVVFGNLLYIYWIKVLNVVGCVSENELLKGKND